MEMKIEVPVVVTPVPSNMAKASPTRSASSNGRRKPTRKEV